MIIVAVGRHVRSSTTQPSQVSQISCIIPPCGRDIQNISYLCIFSNQWSYHRYHKFIFPLKRWCWGCPIPKLVPSPRAVKWGRRIPLSHIWRQFLFSSLHFSLHRKGCHALLAGFAVHVTMLPVGTVHRAIVLSWNLWTKTNDGKDIKRESLVTMIDRIKVQVFETCRWGLRNKVDPDAPTSGKWVFAMGSYAPLYRTI